MAITTTYRGIEYRSRLEARWAAFFTGLGWHFTYEPFDGDGYIPDFLIHGERPLLVEVKPAVTMTEYHAAVAKAQAGLTAYPYDVLIVGADPLPGFTNSFDFGNHPAGLLGERNEFGWDWDVANWMTCVNCGQVAVFHDVMTYAGRPCGCYEGDHFLGRLDIETIRTAWAAACNDVKWRGKSVDNTPAAPVEELRIFDHVICKGVGRGVVIGISSDIGEVAVDFGPRDGTHSVKVEQLRKTGGAA